MQPSKRKDPIESCMCTFGNPPGSANLKPPPPKYIAMSRCKFQAVLLAQPAPQLPPSEARRPIRSLAVALRTMLRIGRAVTSCG
eukprot:scaffold243264_cov45-Prasinocladus_malaysianus.AAC.4